MRCHLWQTLLGLSITLCLATAEDSSATVRAPADHESSTGAAGVAQADVEVEHGVRATQYLSDNDDSEAEARAVGVEPLRVMRHRILEAATSDSFFAETDRTGMIGVLARPDGMLGTEDATNDGAIYDIADDLGVEPLQVRRRGLEAATTDASVERTDRTGSFSGATRAGMVGIVVRTDGTLGIENVTNSGTIDDTEGVLGEAQENPIIIVEIDTYGAVRPHLGGVSSKENVFSIPVSRKRIGSALVGMSQSPPPPTAVTPPVVEPAPITAESNGRSGPGRTPGIEDVTDHGKATEGVVSAAQENLIKVVENGNHGTAASTTALPVGASEPAATADARTEATRWDFLRVGKIVLLVGLVVFGILVLAFGVLKFTMDDTDSADWRPSAACLASAEYLVVQDPGRGRTRSAMSEDPIIQY